MILTKFDVTRLRNYQRAREQAPSPLAGLWRVKMLLLTLIIVVFIGYWISPLPALAYFILGLGAGVVFSVCAIACILPRFWPLTREILNWDRIAELIKEHDHTGV